MRFATTVLSGGGQTVASGGVASATVVSFGGVFTDDGTAVGAFVSSGAALNVFSGGVASGTTVSFHGGLNVQSGGVASGTVVSNVGTERLSGGTAYGTTVSSGGLQVVSAGRHGQQYDRACRRPAGAIVSRQPADTTCRPPLLTVVP